MKILKIMSAIALIAILFTGCEKDDTNVNTTSESSKQQTITAKSGNFSQFDIRYENSEGEFISITEQQLENFIINQFELNDTIVFTSVEVIDDEGSEHVIVQSENATNDQFSVLLDPLSGSDFGESTFLMSAKTCTCSGCSNGCHLTISGDMCYCSACAFEDNCTKTESASTEATYSISDFEA